MSSAVSPALDNVAHTLPVLIDDLSTFVGDVPRQGRQWVVYGSRALGTHRDGSDVDVLLVHSGGLGWSAHRRSCRAAGSPATIYVLSHDDLHADGADRRFGGYFALKLFSPFVTDLPDGEAALAAPTAEFLGPFSQLVAGPREVSYCADQLLAHAHLAFLGLFPDFAGYLARSRRDDRLFQRVWRHQCRVHVAALLAAGYLGQTGNGRWSYTGLGRLAEPDRERSRCTARFWAFGAACHSSGRGFPDEYFAKTHTYASASEQRDVVVFLHDVAAGPGQA